MSDDSELKINVPKFDEEEDLSAFVDVRKAVEDHLRRGIDGNRLPQLERIMNVTPGGVDQAMVSESGFFLIVGWLADEGQAPVSHKLIGDDFSVDIPLDSVFRHLRKVPEAGGKEEDYDSGFLTFGKYPSRLLLKQPFLVQVQSETGAFEAIAKPEIVSDKRLLDTILTSLATSRAHGGKEAGLYQLLASVAGGTIVELFRNHVAANVASHYARTFRPRPVTRTFISVLFGSTEALLMQPVLFRNQGIDFGEWIYVCNSPEDANAALRLGQMISDLYDVMITVIIMPDNVGFGAANNVAVGHASGDAIYLVNPDVYPLVGQSPNSSPCSSGTGPRVESLGRPVILRRTQSDAFGHARRMGYGFPLLFIQQAARPLGGVVRTRARRTFR